MQHCNSSYLWFAAYSLISFSHDNEHAIFSMGRKESELRISKLFSPWHGRAKLVCLFVCLFVFQLHQFIIGNATKMFTIVVQI